MADTAPVVAPQQTPLFLPDRFDTLVRRAADELVSIVVPVHGSLAFIDECVRDMMAAGRGAFLVVRGDSGSGKSTFFNTLNLFRQNVESFGIDARSDVAAALRKLSPTTKDLRVIIIEGREALTDTSEAELERALHAINAFVRAAAGERTLVVWLCNTDDLTTHLVSLAKRLGAEALLGLRQDAYRFDGPAKAEYFVIAQRTVHTLNDGASISDLGVSYERAQTLVQESATIGNYLNRLRGELLRNKNLVGSLIGKERCRLWVVVIASDDPDNDVAALTRGSVSSIDIERLVTATNANIVADLKEFPEKLGILGIVLDAKILHVRVLTALAIVRQFADEGLKKLMEGVGLSTAAEPRALERLTDSELARAFRGEPLGTRAVGPHVGSSTKDAYAKLAKLSEDQDTALNKALGRALVAAGLASDFKSEADLGTGLKRKTDLLCETPGGPVRIEIMWRKRTSRADIANYVLKKLFNYGRAIEFLKGEQQSADEGGDAGEVWK